jgi:hypothetical protein
MMSALDPKYTGPDPHGFLMRAKSNIAPSRGGFAFTGEYRPLDDYPDISAERALWGEYTNETARDIFAKFEAKQEALRKAAAFIREALGGKGPRLAAEVLAEGETLGLNERTLRRAFKRLNGISEKPSFGTGWIWELPEQAS